MHAKKTLSEAVMLRLDRADAPEPDALAKSRCRGAKTWKDARAAGCTEPVRHALYAWQAGCCAYCEQPIADNAEGGHVEHFLKQALFPEKCLDWGNLFLSCNDEATCGKAKDRATRGKADNKCLIAPDEGLGDAFVFTVLGRVEVRAGTDPALAARAEATIAAFNLNAPALVARRKTLYNRWRFLEGGAPQARAIFRGAACAEGFPSVFRDCFGLSCGDVP